MEEITNNAITACKLLIKNHISKNLDKYPEYISTINADTRILKKDHLFYTIPAIPIEITDEISIGMEYYESYSWNQEYFDNLEYNDYILDKINKLLTISQGIFETITKLYKLDLKVENTGSFCLKLENSGYIGITFYD